MSSTASGTVQMADARERDADSNPDVLEKTCARDRTRFPRAGPVIGARYTTVPRAVSQVTLRRTSVVPPGHT